MKDSSRYIGAVDIGGTKIAVGLVRDDGLVLSRRIYKTNSFSGWREGVRAICAGLKETQSESCHGIDYVGIGCTGPVDPRNGVVGDVGLLPGWSECNLVDAIGSKTLCGIAVENDADAAALAESRWGVGQGVDRFLYVTISTGIGAGFVCDGKLYRGANWSHPEMGHHSIDPSGPECYCGTNGCWESLASGTAIARWYLDNVAGQQSEIVTAETVFKRDLAGDQIASACIARFEKYLNLGLANLTKILVPSVIAIGGGVAKSLIPYLESIQAGVTATSKEVAMGKTVICAAKLQDDIGLAGAAAVGIAHRNELIDSLPSRKL